MMELAVIVVLDNPGALAIGPVEQGKPAIDGQRHTKGKLMGWSNKRERRVWARYEARRSDVEPPIIDLDAHEPKLGLLQQVARKDNIRDPRPQTLTPGLSKA